MKKDEELNDFIVAYIVWISAQHARKPFDQVESLWNAYCAARDKYFGFGWFSSKSPKVLMTEWVEAEA